MAKKALGKGLEALFAGKESEPVLSQTEKKFLEIPLEMIDPNPYQPRETFTKEAMENLVLSIKDKGLLQPVTVQRNGARYQLIAGERRLHASKILGRKNIPAYLVNFTEDVDLLEASIIENVQREALDPIELAVSFQRLSEEFNLSHEEIAGKVQKNRTVITNHLRILKLPVEIRLSIKSGEISPGHARPLLSLKNEAQQISLWKKIINEDMNVRKVEKAVRDIVEGKEKSSKSGENIPDPHIDQVTDQLRDIIGTKIQIKKKKKGGVIEIPYYSDDDFERIIELFEEIEK